MANGVNSVTIIGNVGKDPEIRSLPSGGSVANLSIATSESWTDKQTQQKESRTEWHRVTFFNKSADIIAQYVRKGSKLYVCGSLKTRKYQAEDGSDRYSTDIIARDFQMLDSKPQSDHPGQDGQPSQYLKPQSSNQPPPPPNNQPMGAHKADGFDDFDDDLPQF